MDRPGLLLVSAFIIAQLVSQTGKIIVLLYIRLFPFEYITHNFQICTIQVATVISAYVTWNTAGIKAIGWGWCGVIWLYNILCYALLDPIKFAVRYALSGRAWDTVFNQRVSAHEDFFPHKIH